MNLIALTLTSVFAFLQAHTLLAYLVLFVGSFLETLVGVGFFIYGEFLFLPGAMLAGLHVLNIWLVAIALIGGGILGDSASYFLGARYGIKVFKDKNRFLNHKNRQRGEDFFQKYGDKGIFLARLLGPLSWITPFLAGVYNVPYRRFLKYNIPGVLVGIGQFIVVGYFFGNRYKEVLSFVQTYVAIIIFMVVTVFVIYLIVKRNYPEFILQIRNLWRHEKARLLKITLKNMTVVIVAVLLLYIIFLYVLFFFDNDQEARAVRAEFPTFATVESFIGDNSLVVSKNALGQGVQPVNVLIVLSGDIETHFKNNDWLRDVLFSEANLTARAFLRLWRDHEPPVSDLYFGIYPQDLAFQERTSSSARRLHIRLWKMGYLSDRNTAVYFGSVSNDEGLRIALYDHFPVPFHEVSPDADLARDQFLKIFANDKALATSTYMEWGKPVPDLQSDNQKYFTDGRVLFLEFK